MYAGKAAGNLSSDERLAAIGRLMVKEDAAAGVQPIGLAIVHRDPVSVELGRCVGRSRVERGGLPLRRLLHLAKHFGGRCLVEARLAFESKNADRLENSQRPERIRIGGVFWCL